MRPSPLPDVVVAVLTFRRPGDLAEVVPVLVDQVARVDVPAEVLVVDNDPDAGARSFVAGLGLPGVRYVHEADPGIAAARNRAIAESYGSRLLVFIDDDERPCDGWLATLLGCHASTGGAAVVGPVISRYAAEPDPWIVAGRFFERRRLPTGTVVDVAATNNLLLDLSVLRRTGLRFDERFGLSGGSDTLFTRALTGAGHRIVWCDEAVVVDVVPACRLTRRWVLRKAFRSGNSWSRTSLELAPGGLRGAGVRLRLAVKGAVRAAGGAAVVLIGTVRCDEAWQARGSRTLARGLGMLAGAGGHVFQEYRRST